MHQALRTTVCAVSILLAGAAIEYVMVSSIEPRLYLATRLIIDLSRDKVP